MKFVRNIVVVLGALLAVIAIIGLFLPKSVELDRSVVINASPSQVFAHVSTLRAFNEWSPWAGMDPDMETIFEGPATGVGQIMRWSSEDQSVGSGVMEITAVSENKRVDTHLDFGARGACDADFILKPVEGGTQVTWTFVSELGSNPFARYFRFFMEGMINTQYDQGLAKLTNVVEATPKMEKMSAEPSAPVAEALEAIEAVAEETIGASSDE